MDVLALKPLLKSLGEMVKSMNELVGVKLTNPEALDELERHLKKAKSRDIAQVRNTLDELETLVSQLRAQRVASFTPILSEYLRTRQAEGAGVRETSTGWRIGKLELQTKPEAGVARMAYNREPLSKWANVNDVDSLTKLEQEAHAELTRWSIPEDEILSVMHSAYEICRTSVKSPLVPMTEFYKSVRYIQVRKLLDSQGPQADLSGCKLPMASFLLAVDRYRALSSELPITERLGFQTGSSHEVSQKKGYIINGLDPATEYKVVCYVVRVEQ